MPSDVNVNMKTLLRIFSFTLGVLLFVFCFAGRIIPVSLDRQAPDLVSAEIKGEVENPGIYTVKYGSALQDLADAAGGFTENAQTDTLSLVEEVQEGTVYVIGTKPVDGEAALISINTASEEQLTLLPGIGPAMAARIIEYRTEHPFQSLEELMEVKGIGEKTFAKLQELICL